VSMMASVFPHSIARRAVVALLALPLLAAPALATTIERVVSPGGIEAWLVHEPAVPMIAVDFAFVGGAAQDAPGKGGTASLAASLLDEGAGDIDAKTFHARLERKAIELGFQAERDTLRGTLRTLTENKDEAFDYLRLAVTQPRFDATDVEVIRAQLLSMLRRASTSPTDIASQRWWQLAFADHPYGRPVNGTLESLPTVTVADLKDYTHRVMGRGNLKVAVVGDIDAEAVKVMLDRVFGALPAQPDLKPVANVAPQGL
jgi:zinc protease